MSNSELSRRDLFRGLAATTLALALPVAATACTTEGEPQTPVVTVEALLANPEAYKGKKVRLLKTYAQFKKEVDNSDEGIGVSSGGGPQLEYTQELDDYYYLYSTPDTQDPNNHAILGVDSRRGVGQNSSNFAPNPFLNPDASKLHQFAFIEGIWGNDQDKKVNPDGKWYLFVNNAGQELTS